MHACMHVHVHVHVHVHACVYACMHACKHAEHKVLQPNWKDMLPGWVARPARRKAAVLSDLGPQDSAFSEASSV